MKFHALEAAGQEPAVPLPLGNRLGLAKAANGAGLLFTAVITMEAQGESTKYRALVLHADAASRDKHESMGFHEGWGAAYKQMEELMKSW